MSGFEKDASGNCVEAKVVGVGWDTSVDEGVSHVEPSLTVQEVGQLIGANFLSRIPEPFSLRDAYLTFLQGADPVCPNRQGNSFGHQDCMSESGHHFYGLAFYGDGTDVWGEEGYHCEMQASFELTNPNGETFIAGGGFGYEGIRAGEDGTSWMAFIQGTFSFPGANGWLKEGATAGLAVYGSHQGSDWEMEMLGGVGDDAYYLYFEDVTVTSGSCGHHSGSIGLRDPNGGWYWWVKSDQCEECGDLYFNEQSLGSLCLDISDQFQTYADSMRVP